MSIKGSGHISSPGHCPCCSPRPCILFVSAAVLLAQGQGGFQEPPRLGPASFESARGTPDRDECPNSAQHTLTAFQRKKLSNLGSPHPEAGHGAALLRSQLTPQPSLAFESLWRNLLPPGPWFPPLLRVELGLGMSQWPPAQQLRSLACLYYIPIVTCQEDAACRDYGPPRVHTGMTPLSSRWAWRRRGLPRAT